MLRIVWLNQHGLITYYDEKEFFLLQRLPYWVAVWGVLCALVWHGLEKLKKLRGPSENNNARVSAE